MTPQELIFQVVDSFYDKAKTDILIGYHFRVIEDFDTHIPRIAAFWEMQLLGSTKREFGDKFDLINIHTPLVIKRGELGRWLLLFKKTMDEKMTAPEFENLKQLWLTRLDFFEKVFLRHFRLETMDRKSF